METLENAKQAPEDPLTFFTRWFEEAKIIDPKDHNAMCVATVDENNQPHARIILLKAYDEDGFVFYTNKESNKGQDLSVNPQAALCFYWEKLECQVRIDGEVEDVSDEEADGYFNSRPRDSRIGAWASQQSHPLKDLKEFTDKIAYYQQKFKGHDDIPRPAYWSGYRVKPNRIEYWKNGEFRLHTRLVYIKENGTWTRQMLSP